ncbi:MAG: hypothetical protein RR356_07225 [Bacteroidales bacterium]
MKKIGMLLMTIMMVSNVNAQKVKILSGNIDALNGQETIKFTFDYGKMKIDGKSEAAYIAEEVKEKNKDKKGSGGEWKIAWETTDRTDIYQVKFVEDFNKEAAQLNLTGAEDATAEYLATVKTIEIFPGTNAGPFSKRAWVTVEIVITHIQSNEVVAKILIEKAQSGSYDMGSMFIDNRRIGSAYGEAGESLAELMLKILKK